MKYFEKEKRQFFFLPLIEKEKQSITRKKENSYWIGRGNPNVPTWIWTKDNLSREDYCEIKQILEEDFLFTEEKPFTTKKELYELLSEDYITCDYFELGYLECHELQKIKLSPGFMDQPNYGDKTLLAKYWKEYCLELKDSREISMTESLNEIAEMMSENFYVWRDKKGKVVCMASYWIEKDTAKISTVYTPKEERNKGYCKSLIYTITKKLLEEGTHPMLYTDYQYEPSNRAYQKVGYELKQILIKFQMRKGK